jgi:hypothetical protein
MDDLVTPLVIVARPGGEGQPGDNVADSAPGPNQEHPREMASRMEKSDQGNPASYYGRV